MGSKFEFEYYNLYIPKEYIHKGLGIRIEPLGLSNQFEKERSKNRSKFKYGHWLTAICNIKTNNSERAIQIAGWLDFLLSFAQNRSVFSIGPKGVYYEGKRVERRSNSNPVLLRGALYDDLSLFLDTGLNTLTHFNSIQLEEFNKVIHSYLLSNDDFPRELRFLLCWIAIETLSNSHYKNNDHIEPLFTKEEVEDIKIKIDELLDKYVRNHDDAKHIKRSFKNKLLYGHNTFQKVELYLNSLDLGFEEEKLKKLLEKLVKIRHSLVHNLNPQSLIDKPHRLFLLQNILEIIILRLLGVNRSVQSSLYLFQYNRSKEL